MPATAPRSCCPAPQSVSGDGRTAQLVAVLREHLDTFGTAEDG